MLESPENAPLPAVLMTGDLDPLVLRKAMEAYAEELRRHRDVLDSLNLYPVPDGDTGTNLLLTQETVVAAVEGSGTDGIRAAISRASLVGARGNSGVILSQVLRAICDEMPPDGRPAGPREIASALQHASDAAMEAVATPKEGTVLTVLRDAATAATAAAVDGAGSAAVLLAALEAARVSLAGTKDTLPELRAAGVVDAGAKGIVILLNALHATLAGERASEPLEAMGPIRRSEPDGSGGPSMQAFEVQYVLEAREEGMAALRSTLGSLGDSLVVAGGPGLYSVHVHTCAPEEAVQAGELAGRTRYVRIVGLDGRPFGCVGDPMIGAE
jgi:dihydroxyacetone kinase-like predicted kinase